MSVFSKTRSADTVVVYVLRRMRTPLIAVISIFAIAVLGLVLIPGVDDQGKPWSMSFLDAFYFVSYMATTIGFGEIPYPFTSAQRLWVSFMIYPTVIIWLYAFGTILTLMQDQTFKMALRKSVFSRQVKHITSPFFLVCGYGDTGHLLAHAFTQKHQQVVVIDNDQNAIHALEIEEHAMDVPALVVDASQSEHLIRAGINHPCCKGVAAVTDDNKVNLKIAINCKLLNPNLEVACRVEDKGIEANMASFGTDYLINPFDIFVQQMVLHLFYPKHYQLHELLTEEDGEHCAFNEVNTQGLWIICGFGRLGETLYQAFLEYGLEVLVIDEVPEEMGAPEGSVRGRGTEAVTLLEAQIKRAVGIVAATSDDADNLSILMTAKELKSDLFIIARQNIRANDALFTAINANEVMQNNKIVAQEVMARLSTPMLYQFISQLRYLAEVEVSNLVEELLRIQNVRELKTWQLVVDIQQTPSVISALDLAATVDLNHLVSLAGEVQLGQPFVVLAIKRGHTLMMHPSADTTIFAGDNILCCGDTRFASRPI
ncbi:MAG: hypothetical protein AUK35_07515 [Zetaproteobacteria bacterium CG2_30_46_52]|nr:MAG: hypothetical protein AUK35_07515 [Zetaproteobacteria bacterium CG2_30_46_52]